MKPRTEEIWRICPVPRAFICRAAFWLQVDEGDQIEVDNLANGPRVLRREIGVVSHAGVVNQKVYASRHCFGVVPELLPEVGVGQAPAST